MQRTNLLIMLAFCAITLRAQTTILPPTVSLELQNPTDSLPVGSSVTFHAQAQDADGAVEWLIFYRNGFQSEVVQGTNISNATFNGTIQPGNNNFRVNAIDDDNNTGVSQTIRIFGNRPPTLSILEPTGPVTHYSLSNFVTIRAHASDGEDGVHEVRLVQNGQPLASDFQAPYEFFFRPSTFGNYTLQVQAIDSRGLIASQNVSVQYVRIIDNYPIEGMVVSVGTNLTLRANNVEATRQKGEPNHAGAAGGKSVWWAWRPSTTGTVTIDTIGSDFDTVLGVYTNVSSFQTVSNLVAVAASDDDSANAPLSKTKFTAVANQTYYIAVDGRDGFAGNVVLNIRQARSSAAPNDLIAAAIRFGTTAVAVSSNVGATKEPGEPDHGGNAGGASMWWRIDGFSTQTPPLRISTEGSSFDTVLAVYTNAFPNQQSTAVPPMENLRLVSANDDAGGSTNRSSLVELPGRLGTAIWIAVDGYNGAEGNIRLSVTWQQQSPPPPNDRFLNATLLSGSSALTNVSTFGASSEVGEPSLGTGQQLNRSVWYRWTAPTTGSVYLSTKWSDFDTVLGVFVGTNIISLARIASNDDDGGLPTSSLVFNAVAGLEYRIYVTGYQGASGDLVLMLNQPTVILPRLITKISPGLIALSVEDLSSTALLESSTDLSNWTPVRYVSESDSELAIEPNSSNPQMFYRVRQLE